MVDAGESLALTMSVPATMVSRTSFTFLKAPFGISIATRPWQARCLRAKTQIRFSGPGNGNGFGRRSLLGGIAFGALVWRRWMGCDEMSLAGAWPGLAASSGVGTPVRELYLSRRSPLCFGRWRSPTLTTFFWRLGVASCSVSLEPVVVCFCGCDLFCRLCFVILVVKVFVRIPLNKLRIVRFSVRFSL